MPTIATLTEKADGSFEGNLATLNVSPPIALVPYGRKMKDSEPGPNRNLPVHGFEDSLYVYMSTCRLSPLCDRLRHLLNVTIGRAVQYEHLRHDVAPLVLAAITIHCSVRRGG